MDTKDKFGMMTTMPVEPLIVRLAIPTMISMLVSAFYNMADTYFVGKLSTEATAAVGVVFSLQAVIQALGFYFGHGSGNFISRVLGQKKEKEASEMASTGFFSAFLVGILLMVLGLVFAEPLSELLGATPTIREDVISYMQIILVGAPFMMVSFVLNNQLRFQGSAVYAMAGIVCGAVLNIVLDPIFIFGFGMGVSGAALATILSQMVSFLLLLVGVARGSNLKLSLKNVKMNVYYQIEIFRGGFPSLIRQGLGSISTMLLNNIAGGYSDAAIAGMSVVTRISMFANSALIGFGQGFQPVVGFNYGARKFDRVRRSFWFCVKSSTGFLVALSVLGAVFAEPLIAAFRNDAKVIEIGAFTLRAYCVAFPLNSFIVMCNMLFQSTGKTVSASLMASARQGLFLIPCLLVLEGCFGLVGLELSQTVSDFLTFFLAIPLLIWYLKMLAKEETEFQTENS
ncbi:MAG: MATE family efflux transporter [Clostridia bacterium]|nr:MATE family efflux transporter [Clostridia bacterium]